MDRSAILAAFSAPILIGIYAVTLLLGPRAGGFADLAGVIVMMLAVGAAVIIGIVLFFLRSRDVRWWQGLLISAGSVALALGALTMF